MHIVHVVLTGPYTRHMTYQENLLIAQNVKDGHQVTVIASCESHQDQTIQHVPEEDTQLEEGYRLIRLEYRFRGLSVFLSRKVRAVKGLKNLLKTLNPDVIFHHGLQSYALRDIVKYKKHAPSTKLYVDSHEDFHNSANTWASKNLLHKGFYRPIIRKALNHLDTVFYVTYESVAFLTTLYSIPETVMEYYPLGGTVLDEETYQETRAHMRENLKYKDDDIVCIHTGKMTQEKRTIKVLEAFNAVQNKRLKLLIVGVFDPTIESKVKTIIERDQRITYVGWKDAQALMHYLIAADLYLQPGSQSATMQNALCLRCAAAVYPYESHQFLLGDRVFYIRTKDDVETLLKTLLENPNTLENAKNRVYELALEKLDYRKLAKRLYQK